MQTSTKSSLWLFLISFALVFYGMGASFVESFVNYPTWRLIGANEFRGLSGEMPKTCIRVMRSVSLDLSGWPESEAAERVLN